MIRPLLALALASSARAETICEYDPALYNGTYSGPISGPFSGIKLCAPLHRPPRTTSEQRRAEEGGCHLLAGVGRAAPGEDRGRHRIGVVA